MSKTINLNRRTFGGLEVLQYAGTNKHRSAMWKVRCRCGTVKDVDGKRLRNGEAQSCGCSHFLRPFEALHNVLISRSAQRPIEVLLSYEDFLRFTKIKKCHYCSADITWDERGQRYNLDRKDNALGYSKENCVVCCLECNYIKGARFTYEQMLQIGALIKSWRTQ
jgi:hypothetical protein